MVSLVYGFVNTVEVLIFASSLWSSSNIPATLLDDFSNVVISLLICLILSGDSACASSMDLLLANSSHVKIAFAFFANWINVGSIKWRCSDFCSSTWSSSEASRRLSHLSLTSLYFSIAVFLNQWLDSTTSNWSSKRTRRSENILNIMLYYSINYVIQSDKALNKLCSWLDVSYTLLKRVPM